MNTGLSFLLEYRYSTLLTTVFMVFMYSAGMPVLYVIALCNFFLTYWFDKLFCKYLILSLNYCSIEILQETASSYIGLVLISDINYVLESSAPLLYWILYDFKWEDTTRISIFGTYVHKLRLDSYSSFFVNEHSDICYILCYNCGDSSFKNALLVDIWINAEPMS
jgi:hypothetical protein